MSYSTFNWQEKEKKKKKTKEKEKNTHGFSSWFPPFTPLIRRSLKYFCVRSIPLKEAGVQTRVRQACRYVWFLRRSSDVSYLPSHGSSVSVSRVSCVSMWICEWVSVWESEWVFEWVSEWVRVWENEWVFEWVSEWVSESVRVWVCRSVRAFPSLGGWVFLPAAGLLWFSSFWV